MRENPHPRLFRRLAALAAPALLFMGSPLAAQDAKIESEMKSYVQSIPGTDVKFDLVPIRGGSFTLGSPAGLPPK